MSINLQQYARPYANAAFEWAQATQQEASWQKVLNGLAQVFSDTTLQPLLFDPRVGTKCLAEELIHSLGQQLDTHQQNFLKLLAAKHRFALLPMIAELFEALLMAANNRLKVYVRAAWALSEAEQQRLMVKLQAKHQKQIELHCSVDSSLLGGIQIRIGDEVIDASIRGKLQQLAVELQAQ